MNPASSFLPFLGGFASFLGLVFLIPSLKALRRKRLIEDLPTCKTSGIFIGQIELKGTAETDAPLTSYLAALPCVYYAWKAEEHWSRTVTTTNSKGRITTRRESGWATVGQGGDASPFFLQDDEGVVLIEPAGAEIEPTSVFSETCGRSDPLYYAKGPDSTVPNSDHRRRFTETAIPQHAEIFVGGRATERPDVVAPKLAADPMQDYFLISTRPEDRIASGRAGAAFGWFLAGAVLTTGGVALWQHENRHLLFSDPLPAALSALLVFLFAGTLAWIITVYNSILNLRARARQAWANIDVQLKRRADLIPQIVHVVDSLRLHEHAVQISVVSLRTQAAVTPPGQAGPDAQACFPKVAALAEAYPELKTDEAYSRLTTELSQTENRIALARGYFNEIAAFYNTRLEQIPDGWIADLGRFQPQPLMEAGGFERQAVAVHL
jgi:hypothetical protein